MNRPEDFPNGVDIFSEKLEWVGQKNIAETAEKPLPLVLDQMSGYRRTGHGRGGMKPTLFMAAMAARNSNSSLRIYYESLTGRGKKKMVALTALMRKIIVIANARIKEAVVTAPTVKVASQTQAA